MNGKYEPSMETVMRERGYYTDPEFWAERVDLEVGELLALHGGKGLTLETLHEAVKLLARQYEREDAIAMQHEERLPRIYLAGGLDSDWRNALRERWKGRAILIDPFKDSVQDSVYRFTYDDLQHIREADIVFGNCAYHVFDGMALEFGFAHALNKVIVLVCSLPRVPSMMAAVSKAVFTDLEAAVEFVEKKYL